MTLATYHLYSVNLLLQFQGSTSADYAVGGFWGTRAAPVDYRQEKQKNAKVGGFWGTRAAPVDYRQEKQKNAKSSSVSLETGKRVTDAWSVPMLPWERGTDVSGLPDKELGDAGVDVVGAARSK
ncbi:hypothetical protein NDU88_002487 [Pleurodeles waltl]|uniref:Uncharacterized protein n=1 Tax=Pleurodeles waltl TaxID=8319 RepID=A0AAV7WQC4_PLEWA|nr:hypothetical protein NDU88_002487 [Pleurodeles waltl]